MTTLLAKVLVKNGCYIQCQPWHPKISVFIHVKGLVLIYKIIFNTLQSLFHKSINKNDLINFYSHHDNKIKSGITMGFCLRALRMCIPQYLHDKEKCIAIHLSHSNILIILYSSQNRRLVKYFKIKEWNIPANPVNRDILLYLRTISQQ